MALLEFTYDKNNPTVKAITASENCDISFTIQGAGGGGGGSDTYSGSTGLAGDLLHGNVYLNAGETLYCAIGEGGNFGKTTVGIGGADGGGGGYGLDGFSGGTGGKAGTIGWSGGGGGGGGATVLYKIVNGKREYVAIAAGGGGGGGGANYSAGYVKSDLFYGATPGPTTTRSSYLGGVGAGGCGPTIGYGWLGDIQYVTTYSNISAQWWYNGIHVRTGGYMGNSDPTSGRDSQGWYIREISVYENGSVTYQSFSDWGSPAVWPSGYKNLGKADESYIYGDEWAGGGDYWAVYSFGKPVTSITNAIRFSGIIPLVKKLQPDNGPKPTEDLVLIGSEVTQDQLTNLGITTDKSSLQVIEAGQSISWSCTYVADHNFDIGYWIWKNAASASGVNYLYRVTHGEGGRQSGSPSSSFTVPSSFTSTSVLVFGVGDRWSSCPTGANSITMKATASKYIFQTRGGQGQYHRSDGGGAGGGGAGYPGGRGGIVSSGDYGAPSGSRGYSVNYAIPGSGTGERSSSFIHKGNGGGAGVSGEDGYAAFSILQNDINIRISSAWTKPLVVYTMINGSWVEVQEVFYRQNDQWIKIYGDIAPPYVSLSDTFNNTSGDMIPF